MALGELLSCWRLALVMNFFFFFFFQQNYFNMVPILKIRTWLFEPEEWQDVMRAGTLGGRQTAEWRKLVETVRITGLLWRRALWSKVEVTHWMIMKYDKTQFSLHSEQSRSSESDSRRSDPLSRLCSSWEETRLFVILVTVHRPVGSIRFSSLPL